MFQAKPHCVGNAHEEVPSFENRDVVLYSSVPLHMCCCFSVDVQSINYGFTSRCSQHNGYFVYYQKFTAQKGPQTPPLL